MFHPNKLLIDASVDGHHEHNFVSNNLPQDSWTKISVSQLKIGQDYHYKVRINDNEGKVLDSFPRSFRLEIIALKGGSFG